MEKPILFSGAMVVAILAGKKTQTRRIAKTRILCEGDLGERRFKLSPLPWSIGDRLWVREKFAVCESLDHVSPHDLARTVDIEYQADGWRSVGRASFDRGRVRASIHMPRCMSRIMLEVTDVHAERLQDISAVDCKAEGLEHGGRSAWWAPGSDEIFWEGRDAYRWLWEKINGAGSWDMNPLVWVVAFRLVDRAG